MTATTELPTWAVYAVALGTPASAFIGVMVTGWLNRRTAQELERRSRREEVMRLLRWAAELAVATDEAKAELGIDQLAALADSDLLGDAEKYLVDAALESALAEPTDEIERIEHEGEEVQVVQRSAAADSTDGGNPPTVESTSTEQGDPRG